MLLGVEVLTLREVACNLLHSYGSKGNITAIQHAIRESENNLVQQNNNYNYNCSNIHPLDPFMKQQISQQQSIVEWTYRVGNTAQQCQTTISMTNKNEQEQYNSNVWKQLKRYLDIPSLNEKKLREVKL
jgi:hypothetical protein